MLHIITKTGEGKEINSIAPARRIALQTIFHCNRPLVYLTHFLLRVYRRWRSQEEDEVAPLPHATSLAAMTSLRIWNAIWKALIQYP